MQDATGAGLRVWLSGRSLDWPQVFGCHKDIDDIYCKPRGKVSFEDRRKRGHQRMRWLDGIIHAMDVNLGRLLGFVRDREVLCASDHVVAKNLT